MESFPPSPPTCPRNRIFRALRRRLRPALLQSSTATKVVRKDQGSPERWLGGAGSQEPVSHGQEGKTGPQGPGFQVRFQGKGLQGPARRAHRTGGTEPTARKGTRTPRCQRCLTAVLPRSKERGRGRERCQSPTWTQHGRPPPHLLPGKGRAVGAFGRPVAGPGPRFPSDGSARIRQIRLKGEYCIRPLVQPMG